MSPAGRQQVSAIEAGRRGQRACETGVKGQAMAKNTICLWYDKDAEAAARFYAKTLKLLYSASFSLVPLGPQQ
jgi:3-demethylubiquinone-9 3-methyltransferase